MGRARTVIAVACTLVALVAVAYLSWPRHEPVTPAATLPAAPAVTAVPPAPAPTETAKPEPSVEPRRRTRPPAAAPVAPKAPDAPVEPSGGTLSIDSDVAGASVFIDRVYIGTTPAVAKGLAPGRHQLNASVQGYEGISEPIEVEAGEKSLTVRFKEVRLDAAIDVVHKHGIGSCRGRLSATPQAIRYATDNTGDAFTAALSSVDELAVDYLKRNLRVKVKGRTYNFTDPENNADRLFVFQRDVDKARQKLAGK